MSIELRKWTQQVIHSSSFASFESDSPPRGTLYVRLNLYTMGKKDKGAQKGRETLDIVNRIRGQVKFLVGRLRHIGPRLGN